MLGRHVHREDITGRLEAVGLHRMAIVERAAVGVDDGGALVARRPAQRLEDVGRNHVAVAVAEAEALRPQHVDLGPGRVVALRQQLAGLGPRRGRLALQQLQLGTLGPVAGHRRGPLAIARHRRGAVVVRRAAQRRHAAVLELDAPDIHRGVVVLVGHDEHRLRIRREAQHLEGLELALHQRRDRAIRARRQAHRVGLAPAVVGQDQHQLLRVRRERRRHHVDQLVVDGRAALQHHLGLRVAGLAQVDAELVLLALEGGERVMAAVARPYDRRDLEPRVTARVREHRLRLALRRGAGRRHLADVDRHRGLAALVVGDLAVDLLRRGEAVAVIHDLDLPARLGQRLAVRVHQRRVGHQRHPAAILAQRGLGDAEFAVLVVRVEQLAVDHLDAGRGQAHAQHAGLVLHDQRVVVRRVGDRLERAAGRQQRLGAVGARLPAQQLAAIGQDQFIALGRPHELRDAGVQVLGLELFALALLLQLVAQLPERHVLGILGRLLRLRRGRARGRRRRGRRRLAPGRLLGRLAGILARLALGQFHLQVGDRLALPLIQVHRLAAQVGGLRLLAGLALGQLVALLLELAGVALQVFRRLHHGHQRRRTHADRPARLGVMDVQIAARLAERVPEVSDVTAARAEFQVLGGLPAIGLGAEQLFQGQRPVGHRDGGRRRRLRQRGLAGAQPRRQGRQRQGSQDPLLQIVAPRPARSAGTRDSREGSTTAYRCAVHRIRQARVNRPYFP